MSTPEEMPPAEPAVATPTVSTSPPPTLIHRWWSAIPAHIGPARTSTVVLAVLFLLLGVLYLDVRPATTGTVAPASTTGQTTAPAQTATTTAPTTATPTTSEPVPTTSDTTTAPTDEPTTDVPTPTSTGSDEPTGPAVPTTEAPTSTPSTTAAPAPTS